NANVSFTIHGADDTGEVTIDAGAGSDAGKVYESGLNNIADTETTGGTITVNATDGIATVSIGGTAYTLADLNGKFVNTGKGVLTITGVTPATDGKSAEIDYSYTLSAAQTHVAGNGDNTLTDTIAVAVAGVGGSTGSGNVT
ncbi:hypothetical protein, partial [Comamonas jiangduensis]|uniref:hypothetical protein n=1 Tax=Comamonas jiangduensis TaxID=1194168 RepID=UPI003BF8EDCC